MINIGWMILISFGIGFSAFLLGILYLLFEWIMYWTDREDMPPASESPFMAYVASTTNTGDIDYDNYVGGMALIGFTIFIGFVCISLCIQYWPIRLLAGAVVSVVSTVYTIRWMRDTGKSIKKVKETVHEHEEV